MNAYLLTAAVTRSPLRPDRPGQGGTTCHTSIVCADNAEEARKQFEAWLCAPPEGDNQFQMRIDKVLAAQFIGQLLTEKEFVPLDWPQIAMEAQRDMEAVPVDDFEQGYWLDANAVVGPSASLEALREELPEDIRSGLNWAAEKQFLFLLSVLTPPPPPADPGEDAEAGASEESPDDAAPDPLELEADFPELVDKEVAVLIRARNSAVAAWLWRNYAAGTKLADHQIRIDPWCGVLGA